MTTTTPNPLSPRERQVLTALANGSIRSELCVEWGIAPGTINNVIRMIHAKMQCKTTAQAVSIAIRNHWVD